MSVNLENTIVQVYTGHLVYEDREVSANGLAFLTQNSYSLAKG